MANCCSNVHDLDRKSLLEDDHLRHYETMSISFLYGDREREYFLATGLLLSDREDRDFERLYERLLFDRDRDRDLDAERR